MIEQPIEILLVEDDPDDAELTLRSLRESNLASHVEVVTDGAAALDLLFSKGAYSARDAATTLPKVTLLDLKLPKVNGLGVLREIKSHERTRHIPVVMLTSSNEERDLEEAYRLGVNSYIVKPVDSKQFKEAARQIGAYWLHLNQRPEFT